MSGDSSGPPPGFGPDDAGSQEPPAAPPPPSFGAGDRQSSSGDRPAGGLSSDPVQDRRVLQGAPDVPGQAEQDGPARRDEQTYDPSRHGWNSGANYEQPYDSTHHEWNAGAAADRVWGDGRAHRGDWSDRVDASAGYGRRSSWETTTVNASGDGWTRRLREEDPWVSGGSSGVTEGETATSEGIEGVILEAFEAVPGQMVYAIPDTMVVSGPGSEPGSWQDGRSYDAHTDWGAQGGHGGWRDSDDGYKGSRPTEKMTVPTFSAEDNDDLGNSARSYLRQIEVWKRITRVPVNQLGLVLYQHLSGKAWIAAEELSVSKLSTSEGLGYFTSWVSARFLDLEVARIGRAFSDFFRKLRRKPSQTIREYNTEYDRLHGRLREVGCSLPEECAAWLYLDRLQLEESQELNLLASVGNRYSLHHLQHAAVLHDRGQRKPWEGATGKGRRTNYAHMTNHDSSDEDEDGENYEDGIPEEVAEALMTYQSAKEKYRAQQRSRGTVDGNKNGKDETSGGDSRPNAGDRDSKLKAMKARSFCGGCGRKGHWHKDDACPLNRNGGAKADVPKNVAMTNAMPADVYALKHVSDNLMGVADTACARTVAGTQWLQSYTNILAEIGEKPLLKKECEAGRVHYSSFYVIVGFKLGGYNIHVRTSIITGDIPLLLSKTVLGKLGMIYDVQQGKADFRAIGLRDYELASTASGHPAILICPICPVGLSAGETPDLQVEDLRLQQIGQYMEVYAVAHCGPQPPKYSGMFYEKKLDPGTRDMLSGDRLSLAVFQSWWEKSCIDRDFWVETPSTWVRVHMAKLINMCSRCSGSAELCSTSCHPLALLTATLAAPMEAQPCSEKSVPLSQMTKAQLISEALRVGATVHHTWSVQELRATIREHIDTYTEKTASQRMRGLSSMTMPELTKKATEMGVHVPEKITKGALLKLIRDMVSSPGDTIMTIGRWKGSGEVFEQPELVMYARWWSEQQKNKAGRAKIPVEDEDYEGTISSRRSPTPTKTSWEEISVTPSKGYRQPSGKGNTKTTPKRMSPELQEKTEGKMDSQADAAVLQEIADLETKLAILKDKSEYVRGIKYDCVTYGLFTHGGVHGLTRATKDDDALVRFLNHFGREHLGDETKWTSISVTKNVAIGIHKDSNNLRGSLNYCTTVGQQSGGDLWLEADIDEAQARGGDVVWKRDKGGWLPGRYHRTKETFFAFDPFKKHCSTTWEGTRWCITYHTVRGITEVGSEIKKFLRATGFPVAHHKNYKKESVSKPPPKKSVRNNIMNSAGKLSVLMATLLAATGTYLNEMIGPPADYDPIVMMELGGYEGTSEAVENAYYFVTGASPRELRIHLDEMPGHRAHELAKGYENHLKYKTTDNEDAWVILGKSKATKHAQIARPTALPRLLDFNACVGVDIFYCHDINDVRHAFLAIVDYWATTYQVAVLLEAETGPDIERAFNDHWLGVFGPPTTVSLDLDGKVQAGLARLCDWHSIKVKDVAAQAKWQGGVTERQIGWFKGIWERVVHELSVGSEEAALAASMVCAAKNDLRRRCGHSPSQWVLGRSPRVPEDLCDPDSGETATWDLTKDSKFQRATAMRTSARIAFHQAQGDDRLRRGLLHRARTTKAVYEIGDSVHYWNQPKDRRRPHWAGPAVVVGKQGGSYWVSRGGRCRLTAPEHLRCSGPEEVGEYLTMKNVQSEVTKLLAMDIDDPDTYAEETINEDYRESIKRKGDEGDHLSDYEYSDYEGDEVILDPEGDHEMPDEPQAIEHVLPSRRMRKKGKPPNPEDADEVLLTNKPLTKRGHAKRQEKELKWEEIPDHAKNLFKEAEKVQWEEHLSYDALEPLDLEQSSLVRQTVPSDRILPCRWAYRDKNWAARQATTAAGEQPAWRCKSRLVIGGHR
ncbi:unnamed protein product, partial [Symbiodinium sp. CCMP2592]